METESKKNDRKDGKLMWELLPLTELEDVVRVYTFGAEKYGANTWQHLPDGMQRYKAAMLRHMVEFDKGNILDAESGIPHLAHVVWNAIAMLAVSKKQAEPDAKKPQAKKKTTKELWHSIDEEPEVDEWIILLRSDGTTASWKNDGKNDVKKFFEKGNIRRWAYHADITPVLNCIK